MKLMDRFLFKKVFNLLHIVEFYQLIINVQVYFDMLSAIFIVQLI